ncbi:hypothetical protein C8R45DRAFT_1173402 [Mycena sanguinolenta]|nr:hypothetical protein C8R45DRAFT_1173402 [Mycena sanguinolenta]
MASFNVSELPNPLTPMAFIPPEIAHQLQIEIYILVGTLAAYIWDILSNLQNDYLLLTTQKVGIATVTYFFSRFWSLLYLLSSTLLENVSAYPLKNCAFGQDLANISYAIAVPANCFLFFLRARAIFNRDRYLVLFLFVVWLSVLGTAAAIPSGVFASNIGPTPYCLTTSAKSYAGGLGITPVIHDTIVFLAISWRLFENSHVEQDFTENLRVFWTGEHLPRFSKAVLKDGQMYYLTAVAANLLNVIMFYNQDVAEAYRTMFSVCNIMITNCMACLVFRNTKFGYHKRVVTTSELMSRQSGSVLVMHKREGPGGGKTAPMVNVVQVKVTDISEQTLADAPDSQGSKKNGDLNYNNSTEGKTLENTSLSKWVSVVKLGVPEKLSPICFIPPMFSKHYPTPPETVHDHPGAPSVDADFDSSNNIRYKLLTLHKRRFYDANSISLPFCQDEQRLNISDPRDHDGTTVRHDTFKWAILRSRYLHNDVDAGCQLVPRRRYTTPFR